MIDPVVSNKLITTKLLRHDSRQGRDKFRPGPDASTARLSRSYSAEAPRAAATKEHDMEQQSLNTTAAFDRAGVSASLACAVHCALLPLALAALPSHRFPTAQQRLDAGLPGWLPLA